MEPIDLSTAFTHASPESLQCYGASGRFRVAKLYERGRAPPLATGVVDTLEGSLALVGAGGEVADLDEQLLAVAAALLNLKPRVPRFAWSGRFRPARQRMATGKFQVLVVDFLPPSGTTATASRAPCALLLAAGGRRDLARMSAAAKTVAAGLNAMGFDWRPVPHRQPAE